MVGKTPWLAGASLSAILMLTASAAFAGASSTSSAPSNAQLQQEIDDLAAKLQAQSASNGSLRTRLSTLEQSFNDVTWTYNNGRPQIQTGDGRFQLALRARFQVDVANWMQDANLPAAVTARDLGSGAVVRRAYFGIEGKAYNDFWFEYRMNFGGAAAESPSGDTNVNIARVMYTGIPNFQINAGIIEPVQMYGLSVSSGGLMFLERPDITNMVASAFGGADGRRGVEVRFQKENIFWPGTNLFITGTFDGGSTNTSTGHGVNGDEPTQAFGRAGFRLWSDGTSNIQVGAGGGTILHRSPTVGSLTINDRPELRVDGTQLVSAVVANVKDGNYFTVDAEANWQNFYLGGEYAQINVNRTTLIDGNSFSGWYGEASWVLTGETKGYQASAMNNEIGTWGIPAPARPFSLKGNSWGAWELAARYSDTNLNDHERVSAWGIAGGEQKIFTAGINWYLNRNVRMVFDYMNIDVDRQASPGSAPANLTQVGQNLNALAYRLQFQF